MIVLEARPQSEQGWLELSYVVMCESGQPERRSERAKEPEPVTREMRHE